EPLIPYEHFCNVCTDIFLDRRLILRHTLELPAVEVGTGTAQFKEDLGNFHIKEQLTERLSLPHHHVNDHLGANRLEVQFFDRSKNIQVTVEFSSGDNENRIRITDVKGKLNRFWLKLAANENEHVYGGGEQFSYFNLRGHRFPMWAREQGVGRNKSTIITKLADLIAGAGGDYHTTYWPQATFVSDKLYFAHLEYSAYSVLDFSAATYHELELWGEFTEMVLHMRTAPTWMGLVENLTSFFGRQPTPPQWLLKGAVIGLQGGSDRVIDVFNSLKQQEVKISSIWIQDWSGKIMTSLGKRVYWDWQWDPKMYPGLKSHIKRFREDFDVRFLAYINPHVIRGSNMFNESDKNGYFIKSKSTGKTQVVDFGEMECGTVDLTNPKAYEWYKQVIKDMLKLGFSGWMADFGGEYLPVNDAVFFDETPSTQMHNLYSQMWAKLNREAVEEENKVNDTFIFMRSGFGQSPGYTMTSWAGDQNVDFSYADGMASVIPAALSLGMSGMGIHHSDIGGYVSLICMVRTEELILRWAELSVFTPIMRTHEGNRPYRNWQVYTLNSTTKSFARLTSLYTRLAPYHTAVVEETASRGIPAQRPLFLHYPNDPTTYDIKYQYMYGPDILVAPVFLEAQHEWSVYLPPDHWVYLWNGTEIDVKASADGIGRNVRVNAEIGNPPVFYRKTSDWKTLFETFVKG
uniref:Glycoside hydrolase family 31 N-terminal domain-containing protein n=1 Tax=Ciona savignyi TaxID=51511 RepID=H2YA46_CIOSA